MAAKRIVARTRVSAGPCAASSARRAKSVWQRTFQTSEVERDVCIFVDGGTLSRPILPRKRGRGARFADGRTLCGFARIPRISQSLARNILAPAQAVRPPIARHYRRTSSKLGAENLANPPFSAEMPRSPNHRVQRRGGPLRLLGTRPGNRPRRLRRAPDGEPPNILFAWLGLFKLGAIAALNQHSNH